jgi:hypothetical protein
MKKKMHTNTFYYTYSEHLKARATTNMIEKILLGTDKKEKNKQLCRT